VTEKMKYYKVDYNKEYDTGCWDWTKPILNRY
jgi:hypothetical protein